MAKFEYVHRVAFHWTCALKNRAWARLFAVVLQATATMAALCGTGSRAASPLMPVAPAGRNESGSPVFVILGKEALGLDVEPTDLHQMPDGRILVVAPQRLVFGDGTRWETIPEVETEQARQSCAVDADGQIYFGAPHGFGRVRFGENGRWRVEFVAPWPADERQDRNVPDRTTVAGDEWLWHSNSGSIMSWRPGRIARIVGQTESVSSIFEFRGVPYVSDESNGRLLRLTGGTGEDVFIPSTMSLKDAFTCALPWKDNLRLVGTVGRGLELFDGKSLTPFRSGGLLAGDATVNDLCVTEGNLFAAAIENFGIVFFDRNGQTVQTLDHTLDHRLAHVKKLLPTPGGTIFGLLDQGLLEVEFPSRVSNMEPMVSVGVTIPAVQRFQGDLWVYSAEKLLRGVYDAENRLVRLEVDTPAGHDITSYAVAGDRLVAGADHGAFFHTAAGWVPFAPETRDLRVLRSAPFNGRWLYAAQDEIGWLRATATGFEVERIPAPGLERVHSAHEDGLGRIWLELGTARVGRIEIRDGTPALEVFTGQAGLTNSWVAPFTIDEKVIFNVSKRWLRFDEPTRHFVVDDDFTLKLSGVVDPGGRPSRDGRGRLWVSALPDPQVLDDQGTGLPQNLHEKFPPGLQPWTYFPETDGVVWMVSYHRLSRYDPAFPVPAAPPLRALITHVTLPASNRTLGAVAELPPLDYSDNSLVVHFVAPGRSFASSVTFEVKLEGTSAGWSPVGSNGSAVFNRLKEGHYVLHVMPSVGETRGAEAVLAFSIRPPWFRTPLALAIYVVLGLGLFGLSVWLAAYLHRRENTRLEKLVAERTASLQASEARLQTEFELMPTGCIVWGPDWRVQKWNPAAQRIFGYSPAEAVGLQAEELVAQPETGNPRPSFLAPTAAADLNSHHTSQNVTKSRKVIWCEWTNAPLRDEGGAVFGVMSMVEDITGRKVLEEQLRQAQKLEVIGRLAGGVAHDFNNILTAMNLIVVELRESSAPAGSPLADLELMTQRAAKLTQQLLVFARKQVMQFTPLNLIAVVNDVMKLLGRLLGEHVTVRLESNAASLWVEADAGMLDQMIMNLCLNARDAMPEGGTLTLAMSRAEFAGPDIIRTHPEARPGRFVCLSISDTGIGMKPEILEHIFEPFFTTKDIGLGTGLGLATVYGIAHQHQGWVEVESTVGRGTTFRVYLPNIREPAEKPAPVLKAAPDKPGTETILLVEDEEPVRKFVKTMLERLGYRVLVATDGPSAQQLWAEHAGQIDLLLTDMVMPNRMTGIQLGQLLRQTKPGLKIIVMSGYNEDSLGDSSQPGERIVFLAKPFAIDGAARTIRQCLDGTGPSADGSGQA